MRAWPAPGSPTWTSSYCMTSGPPCLWKRTAFAMGTLLSEDGQDAGVAVQPVAGDFAITEESYQRNLAERSLDEVQFRTPAAEHVLAARHARVVERTAG